MGVSKAIHSWLGWLCFLFLFFLYFPSLSCGVGVWVGGRVGCDTKERWEEEVHCVGFCLFCQTSIFLLFLSPSCIKNVITNCISK